MREPILFLPDAMTDLRLFEPQIAALSGQYAVMSAPLSTCDRIENFASDLLSVLPPRIAVVGQGLGGTVALELVRRAPNRVTRLALVGTSFQPDTPAEATAREPQMVAASAGRFEEIARGFVGQAGYGPGAERVAVQAALLRMALDLGPSVFRTQSRALQKRRDQQPVLRQIAGPVLLLGGRHDKLCPPKRLEFMAELMDSDPPEILEQSGRYPSLEEPQAVTEALRGWLAR
ncbi:alpha/beta fold hydrolase [Histidinibacterium aquaticum]|uniref:Alpha/beta fold hydrolase n=1 Tax=Histidinibacterium aquaticum TaxID=2613962 RepID=A0A5J5GQJ6_9RHOB|nr:alpha/beta hydrolase [Histidinibacterium aquaticum]KAA9009844.1 alpha/beta fold hydrolase [Histidinibacterium aquaticum]